MTPATTTSQPVPVPPNVPTGHGVATPTPEIKALVGKHRAKLEAEPQPTTNTAPQEPQSLGPAALVTEEKHDIQNTAGKTPDTQKQPDTKGEPNPAQKPDENNTDTQPEDDFSGLGLPKFLQDTLSKVQTVDSEKQPTEGEEQNEDINKDSDTPSDQKKDEPEIKLPKDTSKKVQESFAKLRTERAEFKRKYEELVAQIENGEHSKELNDKLQATQRELQELKERYQDAQQKIYLTDVYSSDVYQQNVAIPIQTIRDQVIAIAKANDIPERALLQAVQSGKTEALDEVAQGVGNATLTKLVNLQEKTQEALDIGKRLETYAEVAAKELRLKEQESQKQKLEQGKRKYQRALDVTLEEFSKLPFLQKTGDPESDAQIDEYIKFVKTADPSSMSPEETAQVISQAAMLPITLQLVDTLSKAIVTLQARNRRISATKPGAGGGAGTQTPTKPGNTPPTSIAELVKKHTQRAVTGR